MITNPRDRVETEDGTVDLRWRHRGAETWNVDRKVPSDLARATLAGWREKFEMEIDSPEAPSA